MHDHSDSLTFSNLHSIATMIPCCARRARSNLHMYTYFAAITALFCLAWTTSLRANTDASSSRLVRVSATEEGGLRAFLPTFGAGTNADDDEEEDENMEIGVQLLEQPALDELELEYSTPHEPDYEYTQLPAPIFNNKLFVWGARITMMAPNEPVLELLVIGKQHAAVPYKYDYHQDESKLGLSCSTTTNNENGNMMVTSANFTVLPNLSIDINAANGNRRFVCPISMDYMTSNGMLEFQVKSKLDGTIKLQIPRHTDSIGLTGPENALPIPFHEQRKVKYMLCSGGNQPNSLHLVPEWIQHHLRIGFNHILFGLDGDFGDQFVEDTQLLLGPLIDTGVVTLYVYRTPGKYFDEDKRDLTMGKDLFNDVCLSYSKSKAKYLALWDLDEFWLPVHFSNKLDTSHSLLDQSIGKYAGHRKCPDWCTVSFGSYVIDKWVAIEHTTVQRIANEMQQRQLPLNLVWHKSLAKTKNTFSTSLHHFGTCLHNGEREFPLSDGRSNGCAQFRPDLGMIHHFHNTSHMDTGSAISSKLVRDEYSKWTLQQGYSVKVTKLYKPTGGSEKEEANTFVFNRVPGEEQMPPREERQ